MNNKFSEIISEIYQLKKEINQKERVDVWFRGQADAGWLLESALPRYTREVFVKCKWEWDEKSWEDMSRAQAEELMEILGKFFKNHTKDELLKLATENRFQLGPCNNAEDILKYPQLQDRGFWKDIEHPELGASMKYPGGAVMTTQGYVGAKHRAPLIGEHNDEVYHELGLSTDDLKKMKKQKVI